MQTKYALKRISTGELFRVRLGGIIYWTMDPLAASAFDTMTEAISNAVFLEISEIVVAEPITR